MLSIKEDILNNVCGKKYYGSQWGPETVQQKKISRKKLIQFWKNLMIKL